MLDFCQLYTIKLSACKAMSGTALEKDEDHADRVHEAWC